MDWELLPIGEIGNVTKLAGFEYTKHITYVEDGEIIALRALNVRDGKLDLSDVKRIYRDVSEGLQRSKLIKNDILFTYVGANIGQFALIPENDKFHLAPNICRIRCSEHCHPYFLFSYFRSEYFKESLDGFSHGSSQPTMPMGSIRQIPIPIPPFEEQKAIGSVLSSLDDKIDLLHRQNQTLEQMAETLFRQWFVEEADEGWEVKKLKELVDIGIGRTPPRKEFHWFSKSISDVKWVSIKDLGDSGVFVLDTSEYLTEEAVEKFNIPIIPPDTVLLSFKMTLGRVAITTEHMLSNEAIAHFKFNEETPFSKEFLYFYLKTYPYETLGSTSSIVTSINSGMIKDMEAIIPDDETLTKFENQVIDFFDKIKSNQKQINNLSALRDTLLPKLMSGEIKVE